MCVNPYPTSKEPISFEFFNDSEKSYLRCLQLEDALIRMKMPSETTPLNAKESTSCCYAASPWEIARVSIGNQEQQILVKINDIVKKWKLSETEVREKCEYNLSDLARQALQKRVRPDLESTETKDQADALYDPIFYQFRFFLIKRESIPKVSETVSLIQERWLAAQDSIHSKKSSWAHEVLENESHLYFIHGFGIEYFRKDASYWIHLNCGPNDLLVLNGMTTKLYRKERVLKSNFEVALKIEEIQKQPIEEVRCSLAENTYSIYRPFFKITLQQAIKEKRFLNDIERCGRFANKWLRGLQALHANGIIHGGISQDSLLFIQEFYSDKEVIKCAVAYSPSCILSNDEELRKKDMGDFMNVLKDSFPDIAFNLNV